MDIEFYNKLNQALHGDAGKIDRVMRFRYLNEFVKPGQILFAGSSLMEQFPIQEFIADFDLPLTIYNRGVGGFTTSEMLACMQDCVYALRPVSSKTCAPTGQTSRHAIQPIQRSG